MTSRAQGPARLLLLFTDVYAHGGIQRFNQTLMNALTTFDVECDVLSIHDSENVGTESPLRPRVRFRGFGGSRARFSLAALRLIITRRYEWVVVGHINLLVFAVVAVVLKHVIRPRLAIVTHGIEVWYRIARSRRWALSQLDMTLSVSSYTRQRMLDQVPHLDADKVRLFPNSLGSNWAGLKPAPSTKLAPVRFILSVSRLERGDRYKGITTVIEALSQLEDDTLQYFIVGHGDDLEFLQLVAVRYGVAHRVHFLHGISDLELVALYANCEAFVLPSGKEGFGIVFLEAMYFGAPVIAASEKGALDVIKDRDTGLLVRFGDSPAIKMAIEALTSDSHLRDGLRERGRATVTGDGEYTFTRFTARTGEVFGLQRQSL